MKSNNFINIGYSIDGMRESYELNRIDINGKSNYNIVLCNAKKILDSFESVVAMSVVTKNNIVNLSKNVDFLIKFGFKYINLLFDYTYEWEEEDLLLIKQQIKEVSDIYSNKLMQESDVDIPILDEKIRTYISKKYDCNNDCNYGMNVINVGTDGNFYPCMQFVNNDKFIIGNCKEGINKSLRENLSKNIKKENDVCKKCAINKRCKHTCACRNFLLTGNVNKVSPFICETEKIFIEIADEIAEKLYK